MSNKESRLKALATYINDLEEDKSVQTDVRPEPPFIFNDNGKIINDNRNGTIFFEYCLPGSLRYNEFTNKIEKFGSVPWDNSTNVRPWTDTDEANALMYANDYGYRSKQCLAAAVQIVADRYRYHPVRDYIESLPYLGDGYIRRLAVEYMGCADSEYTYEVMKLLLLAMVQRIYHPGCKYDYVVIFQGDQGSCKSSFWRNLARDDSWFSDNIESFDDRKKLGELIQGVLIVELGEMSAFNKSDIECIKAVVTSQVDSYREAYSKYKADYPRTTIFVGTTNKKTFLKDSTGNRRFLVVPIDAEKRTKDLFDSPTRDQDFDGAWAEAYHMYKDLTMDGGLIPLILPRSVMPEAQDRQNNANDYEDWAGIIEPWLDTQVRNGELYTASIDIWVNCFLRDKGSFTKRDSYRINQIMDGYPLWERASGVRISKKSSSGYDLFEFRGRGYHYIGAGYPDIVNNVPFD